MTQRFTILRITPDGRKGGPFLGGNPPSPGFESAPRDAKQLRFEDAELDKREAALVARERGVSAVVPVMPIKLVKPLAPGPEAGADATDAAYSWGLREVGALESRFTGEGVVVAVLDTGIEAAHPAFKGVQIVARNFGGGDAADVTDVDGHGTHCAGTIFGRDVGGARIGVAPGVKKALVGKVLDDQGNGDSAAIFKGLQWAIGEGAHVVSMSIGFDFPGMVQQLVNQRMPADIATSQALIAFAATLRVFDTLMALARPNPAYPEGCVVVGAAGNESRRDFDPSHEVGAALPSSAQDAISVGALDRAPGGRLAVATFSNTAPLLSAPGVRIKSAALGGGLKSLSGTSMAAPHVAGVAALWWQALREAADSYTNQDVVARLRTTARTDVFAPGVDAADRGRGRVRAPPVP